ncbi:thiol-disulfide isomerase/thioredoxin [Chitinophaga dinghuensis]|uniref:Thiol-disulfide isomerase/thioredoxin n=1 Tax=Chitinophaga dinghuensis TaxID=1539050 RepID=A0A327WAV1_9BACT|nr:TlpA disulfide reductase family protein [Chitinophaga dinghuensis]RAJ83188.1 thiol-disulfide isomerase/thioredoxin [Chitinophaga dinghuensis]
MMKAIRFFLFLLLCHTLTYATTPPVTTLHVKVNILPTYSGMINLNTLDSKSDLCKGEMFFLDKSKPVAVFSRPLAAATQIMSLNGCSLLTNAGDQVNLELFPLYRGTEVIQGRFRPVCSGKEGARQVLPYQIDSLYSKADLTAITTTQQATDFITATTAKVAKLISAAKVINPENLAALQSFEQSKQLLFKFNFLDAHKELARTKEIGDWYLSGFDIAAPGLSAIGDDELSRQTTHLWCTGRKMQDSIMTEATQTQEILLLCKANRIKTRVGIDWLALEGRTNAFTPDMKQIYPLIKEAVKYNPQATRTLDSLYQSYQQMTPGTPAYNFALENDKGEVVRLSDLKGKIVILDIWAMWCTSCVASLPHFRELADSYKDKKDIIFLTIAWEDPSSANRAKLKQFSVEHKIDGANNLFLTADRTDPQGKAFVERYCMTGITRWVAIDQDGNIMNGNLGHPLVEGFDQKIANCYQKRK